MASRFVRSSKYRHVFGNAAKKEKTYDNLTPSRSAWDSNKVAASGKHVAVVWEARGGGSFAVIPKDSYGKIAPNYPLICGHTAEVLDIEFNPFNDNLVASGSEDGYCKIWNIPDAGLTESMTDPVQTLMGHKRKVGSINHNPVANNVLATTSTDYSCKVWDIEKGETKCDVTCHVDIIQSVAWNRNGSLFCTTSKDKKLRILDPRSAELAAEVEAHSGVKGMRAIWLGKREMVLTTGFSKTSDRQYAIWDPKDLSKPIAQSNIDTASGIIMPFYDDDTSLLYLAGKGDGNIRYYELVDEAPFIHYISEFKSNVPQRGMGVAPKLIYDFSSCEVMRLLKLSGNSIDPVSFCVPRKSDIFQDDLYPDTYAFQPAESADEWFSGKNAEPKMCKIDPGEDFASKRPAADFKPEVKEEPKPLSETELRAEVDKLTKRVAFLEAEIVKKDAKISELTK
jgi:WD40 repeat protein